MRHFQKKTCLKGNLCENADVRLKGEGVARSVGRLLACRT